jgi:hypothetical protein
MKKLLAIGGILAGLSALPASADPTRVRELATNYSVGAVNVSTNTATAIPTTAYSERYKIVIENTDSTYDVSIGTYSGFTYANGFIITNSTDATTARLELPISYQAPLYGLGEGNVVRSTVNVRFIEYK